MVLSQMLRRCIKSSSKSSVILRNFRMCSSITNEVLFDETAGKGIITLNRPKALNSLNYNMVQLIYPKMKHWETTKSLVIIKGAGSKAFCAGGDVVSVTKDGQKGGDLPKVFFRDEYKLNCLIGTYHIPYIALLDGIVMGGGVGVSVHGTYRVATEKTLFAMPETGIGLFPDVGGSYFLPRLGGRLGMYLALTGHRLKGRDVMKAGVATHVCDSDRVEELEAQLLKINTPYQENIATILKTFSDQTKFDKDKEFSLKTFLPQIEKCFKGNSVEDILVNLEKDGSEWALKQLSIISKMSPTSLKITFELLERGANLTLQECLAMEYRLTQRCCEDHDFYEGVRSLLIDRDNSPIWKPDSLDKVDQGTIDRYFSNLPDDKELVF